MSNNVVVGFYVDEEGQLRETHVQPEGWSAQLDPNEPEAVQILGPEDGAGGRPVHGTYTYYPTLQSLREVGFRFQYDFEHKDLPAGKSFHPEFYFRQHTPIHQLVSVWGNFQGTFMGFESGYTSEEKFKNKTSKIIDQMNCLIDLIRKGKSWSGRSYDVPQPK